MTASLENLPNPGNTEGEFLNLPHCCSAAFYTDYVSGARPAQICLTVQSPLCCCHCSLSGDSHPYRTSVPCLQTKPRALFHLTELKRVSCRLPGTWSLCCSHEDQTGTELLQQEFEKIISLVGICGNMI